MRYDAICKRMERLEVTLLPPPSGPHRCEVGRRIILEREGFGKPNEDDYERWLEAHPCNGVNCWGTRTVWWEPGKGWYDNRDRGGV